MTKDTLFEPYILSWFGGGVLQAWRQGFSQNMLNRLNAVIVDEALTSVMPQLVGNRDGDSGRLLGVMERLPYSLQVIVEGLIWQIAPTLVQVLISLAIILSILKPLSVVILALTLVGFAISAWFGAVRQNTVSLEAGAAAGHVSETLGDVLRNARRVVLNGALSAERQLMAERFEAKRQAFRRMLTSQTLMALLQYGTAGLGLACLLTLVAYDVLAGRMTIGEFVLLQAYGFRLVLPLSGFGFVISQAAIALLTVREVLDLGRDEQAARIISTPPDGAAELVLRDVAFSYGPGLSGLHDVSVTLAPGSFNVIVGPNGSDKSTLAQVMAGLL